MKKQQQNIILQSKQKQITALKQHPQTSPNVYFHLFFLCVFTWYSVKKITLKRRCLFFYACSVLELIPILFYAHYRLPIFNCKYFLREDCRHIAIPRCCWRGINLLPTVSNLPNHILVNNIIFLANIHFTKDGLILQIFSLV